MSCATLVYLQGGRYFSPSSSFKKMWCVSDTFHFSGGELTSLFSYGVGIFCSSCGGASSDLRGGAWD